MSLKETYGVTTTLSYDYRLEIAVGFFEDVRLDLDKCSTRQLGLGGTYLVKSSSSLESFLTMETITLICSSLASI